jgi:hypothetical protein
MIEFDEEAPAIGLDPVRWTVDLSGFVVVLPLRQRKK